MAKQVVHFKLEVDLVEGVHFISPENADTAKLIKSAKEFFYPFLRQIVLDNDVDEWAQIKVTVSQEDGD